MDRNKTKLTTVLELKDMVTIIYAFFQSNRMDESKYLPKHSHASTLIIL